MALSQILTLRKSGSVKRHHTYRTLVDQSVAEHSWHAATLAGILATKEHNIDQGRVVMHMLTHDAAETYTGDAPANAKKDTELGLYLDRMEERWRWLNLSPTMNPNLTIREEVFCSLVDTMEFMLFCCEERALGNYSVKTLFYRASDYAREKLYKENVGKWNILEQIVEAIEDHFSQWNGDIFRHEILGED